MNKLSVMIAASALAFGAWATPSFVQFSSVGPDKYADGETVVDGEIYALVSVSGEFEGINSDGSTVDPNDVILYAAPLAKGGHCKTVFFTLKEGQDTSNLAVYLLDTRVKTADGKSTVTGVDEDGKLTLVNSYAEVDAIQSGEVVAKATEQVAAEASALATVALSDVPAPTITGIKVVGAKVEITVANTVPELRYTVTGGETPSTITKKDLVSGINGSADGITLVVDSEEAKDCRFFKVTRATK